MVKRSHVILSFALLPLCAGATAIADVDVLSEWQRERVARLGAEGAFAGSNATLVRQLLVDPASPYSPLAKAPDFTNELDWPELVGTIDKGRRSSEEILAVIQWDLGATRARPDVDITPGLGFRDSFVAASATKAGLDPDIFWHVLDLTGFRHSARGATYAAGMQLLRRQMASVDPDRYIAVGIDDQVFERVMRARHMDDVLEYDLGYLSTLVQYRLIHWRSGERGPTGRRSLPMTYRVARIAAAYRDTQGYLASAPCHPDASPVDGVAGTGLDGDTRPLCFVAATDRAVHRWYVEEVRRQATYVPEREESGLARFMKFAGAVLMLIDMGAIVEVIEAAVADDLVASEAITATEADVAADRADRLFCANPE